MTELTFCRICLDNSVPMHKISGSEVEDVFRKMTNKVQGDRGLYSACYICYYQLQKCQQLVMKSRKAEALLNRILSVNNELNLDCISLRDRQLYGLVNSLTHADTECFQIIKKPENQCEDNTIEVMIKNEPDDYCDNNEVMQQYGSYGESASLNKTAKQGEEHICKQKAANFKESGKKEKFFGTQMITVTNRENTSHIIYAGKSSHGLDKGDTQSSVDSKRCTMKSRHIKHSNVNKHVNIKLKNRGRAIQKSIHDNKFTINNTLKKDFNIPTCEKTFQSEHCNYTTVPRNYLKSHIKTHTGDKQFPVTFQCGHCFFTCLQKDKLKNHLRIHTGADPFECQYCNYSCKVGGQLKRHMRTHRKKAFEVSTL